MSPAIGRDFNRSQTPKSESRGGNPLANFLLPFQQVVGQTVKGTTGIDLSPEVIAEKSLIEQAAEKTGDVGSAATGSFLEGLGIDPKLLLIGGAAIGALVLIMVVAK